MLKDRNEIWIGLVVGLLLPFVGYALLLSLNDYLMTNNYSTGFRPRSLALIAVCLNILPMNVFMSRSQGQSMRGILIVTMAYAIVWFLYFRESLLG